jgi:hypothetical protein
MADFFYFQKIVIYKTHTNLTILLRSLTWQQDRVKHVEQRQ